MLKKKIKLYYFTKIKLIILVFIGILLLSFYYSCSKENDLIIEPGPGSSGPGSVMLKSPTPIENNMQFTYSGAQYDTYYTNPPHWKITSQGGWMKFTFNGKYIFKFHALGSTSNGVSYCYINVIINGNSYISGKFIDKYWTSYSISSSAFGSGTNYVKIVFVGNTHFWIDEAKTY